MTPRFKTAAIATVLVGALAGPSVTGAVASTHSAKRAALSRSEKRELKALKTLKASRATTTDPPTGPELAIDDAIQNLEFDLSSQGVQALLGDFPLVGDYG
jgi:hypothetical protein